MEIRVLGPLEVEVGGRQVRLGPQQGVMLAVLLLEAGRVVPRLRLIELLWGEEAPEGAGTTLRSHVRNLRRSLEPERKARAHPEAVVAEGAGEAAGYALRISPDQVDAYRFERLLDEGRRALAGNDPSTAATHLRAGLALWRGRALADVADRPFALREVARLEGLRRAAQQALIEAELACGRHAEVVGELEGLVAQQPHDEGLRRQLALALYRSRRQEEAARVCQEGLTLLHDRGLDSSALQALQRDILRQAPELEWTQPDAPEPARPFQLPPDIAEFTGRRAELASLRARLISTRPRPAVVISAIDGKPGIGKSALAIHVAHQLAPQFPDGVLYVNLRGTEPERLAPAQVIGHFLRALGVADEDVPPDVDVASASYRTLLADRRVLVVLDNAADAGQVRPLLPGGAGCAVLVTSRAPLVDLEGAAPLSLGVLDEDEAVTLFSRIAGRRRVTAEPAAAAAVVRHCGLLPLAVRIAGARLRARPAWPVAALAGRLTDECRRLEELQVGELAVRASFQLSYQSLGPAEARTFRLLGLLEGPDATPEVAAALAECPVSAASTILERLVDAQLVETPVHGRYRLHDLLRLFACERAEAEEDEHARSAALERALGWYLATAEHATELLKPTALRTGGDQPFADRQAALDWFEAERANLVAAVNQAAAHAPAALASIAWRLSDTLFRFFYLRKHWQDWQAVCEAAIQAAQRTGDRLAEAGPRNSLGVIRYEQRRYDDAIASYEESLAIYRAYGNHARESALLSNLGSVLRDQRRFDEAIGLYEQSLEIARQLRDRVGEGGILNNLGVVYREQRQFDAAIGCLEQSLAIWQEVGDRPNEGLALSNIGDAHREQQRFKEAIAYYGRALAIFREVDDRYGQGLTLKALGSAVEAEQGTRAARPYWTEALSVLTSLGAPQTSEVQALLEMSYGVTNSSA